MSIVRRSAKKIKRDGIIQFFLSIPKYIQSKPHQKDIRSKDEIHKLWANDDYDARVEDKYDFAGDSSRSYFLYDIIKKYAEPTDEILEPGCRDGRNLINLYERGYHNLTGIDINSDAIESIKQNFPNYIRDVSLHTGKIEEVITEFETDKFDIVYTMAVLEHIHPDSEFVFEEIARISNEYILTIEDEQTTSPRHVPRNYEKIFTEFGFELVETIEEPPNYTDLGSSLVTRIFRNK